MTLAEQVKPKNRICMQFTIPKVFQIIRNTSYLLSHLMFLVKKIECLYARDENVKKQGSTCSARARLSSFLEI